MAFIPVNILVEFSEIADGYFFDTEKDQLLSNKSGIYVPLNGTVNKNGIRRYNLQLKPERKSVWVKSRSVKHDELAKLANEAAKRLGPAETTNKLVEVAKVQAQKQTKGWLIGLIKDGYIMLDDFPKVYGTEAEVNAEIEQQALSNTGTTFVKLKVENFVVCGRVQWS